MEWPRIGSLLSWWRRVYYPITIIQLYTCTRLFRGLLANQIDRHVCAWGVFDDRLLETVSIGLKNESIKVRFPIGEDD